jgi:hypothetical protein
MHRILSFSITLGTLGFLVCFLQRQGSAPGAAEPAGLSAGFAEADITPRLDGKTVYLAGFGQNRKATGVHDPLLARAVVLKEGERKIALVAVDLVGFFYANVRSLRRQLADFHYVLVSSTHNHEGPDTLGIWGPNAFTSGVDPDYLAQVEAQIVRAVRAADRAARPATARIGSRQAPELLTDNREPQVKHDDLVALEFREAGSDERIGLLVQWNCHPETLGSKNTQLSADFVGYTVQHLQRKYRCPVAYFTGTVGGLLTSLEVAVCNAQGELLADGTFEKTERYGILVGQAAEQALDRAQPLRLTPVAVRRREVFVPMDNRLYQAARVLGVLQREAFVWTGDPYRAGPAAADSKGRLCLGTEVAILRLGELEAVAVPGEIYPELVLGRVQDPADPGADFPDAPIEPAVYQQLRAPHRLILGLANDEIGYILPRRQWDVQPPFCYGRRKAQYGEENSVGPDAGPVLCRALQELAGEK